MHRCGSSWIRCSIIMLFAVALFSLVANAQSTGGRILGKITDPSGAVIPGATVTITNEDTGVANSTNADKEGNYGFPDVPVGRYTINFVATGFKQNALYHVSMILNQVITLNQTMQLGQKQEVVDVSSEAPIVDTTSTQLGAVMGSRSVEQLPLNTRDTYQLLQLQPGVMSNVGGSNSIAYGSDQPGVVSVNGGRGRSNNFSVNGGDANDLFANLPTVQPNPDTIEEFRMITNTFDAEYGRNSGAVINVVTKSGTNNWHGSMYEFFRNKVLNAKGYFDNTKPDFQQNQFGATFGGPIVKDRTFFFASYEGRRIKQGIPTDFSYMPDAAQRGGDFSSSGAFLGSIGADAQATADLLNGRSGCTSAIMANGGKTPAAGSNWSDIFPNGVIPTQCMDPTAVALMKLYVPMPNRGNVVGAANAALPNYQSAPNNIVNGDQGSFKFDHRLTNNQNLNFYYYIDDSDTLQALSFFQAAGANVPGFGSSVPTRVQQYNLSHTWTISNTVVNEARLVYMREGQKGFQKPMSTNLVQDSCGSLVPASNCFSSTVDPRLGITPNLGASYEGVPFISVNGSFTIGNNFEGQLPQVGNSFQLSDNISKVLGNHTMKFGVDLRRQLFDQTLYYNVNGYYTYDGSGENSPLLTTNSGTVNLIPDYLLGLPNSYSQGSAQRENVLNHAIYLFAQDSWKIKPNLTLNYGLRWELNTPLADQLHHVQTYRPGQATAKYPCQLSAANASALNATSTDCSQGGPNDAYFPLGLVVPGDQNVPAGLTSTDYKAFAPRIGIAWAPSSNGDGLMHKLFGNQGDTSIRAGFGLFYNPIEQLVLEQFGAEPPFGGSNYITNPQFNTPFLDQSGTQWPNPFNGFLTPPQGTPIDWSSFRPILLYGDLQPHLKTQYSEQYNLSIQRSLSKDLVLQVGYVGSQGHHLLVSHDINYGNPQTCLDLIALSNLNANAVQSYYNGGPQGPTTCGPFGSDSAYYVPAGMIPAGFTFHLPNGQTVQGGATSPAITLVGTRRYSSPNCNPLTTTGQGCPYDGVPVFSNIFAEDTIGNSNYNSLQTSLQKRFSNGLQFQLAYTWSKSFDLGSTFEGSVDPIDPRRSYALSAFDARHRLVWSYDYEIPVRKMTGFAGKALNGWETSGILTLQSGFPIRITTSDDLELYTSTFFESAGEPNQVKQLVGLSPQKNNGLYFDPATFQQPANYGVGNSQRTVCCGPGIANWDMTFQKNTKFGERWNTEFRAEFFNIFNHTQFYNPDGNISDPTFGYVREARDPRLIQFALKLSF